MAVITTIGSVVGGAVLVYVGLHVYAYVKQCILLDKKARERIDRRNKKL